MDFGGNRRGKIDRFFFLSSKEKEKEEDLKLAISRFWIFLKVLPIPYSRPEVVNI